MANPYTDVINAMRDTERPTNLIDSARFGDSIRSNMAATGANPNDNSGYWNGDGYVSFFVIGQSLIGVANPDVLS